MAAAPRGPPRSWRRRCTSSGPPGSTPAAPRRRRPTPGPRGCAPWLRGGRGGALDHDHGRSPQAGADAVAPLAQDIAEAARSLLRRPRNTWSSTTTRAEPAPSAAGDLPRRTTCRRRSRRRPRRPRSGRRVSWPLNGGIGALPFVTRSFTSAASGFASSRFGPTAPVAPASASVWQLAQPADSKTAFPAATFPAPPPPPPRREPESSSQAAWSSGSDRRRPRRSRRSSRRRPRPGPRGCWPACPALRSTASRPGTRSGHARPGRTCSRRARRAATGGMRSRDWGRSCPTCRRPRACDSCRSS